MTTGKKSLDLDPAQTVVLNALTDFHLDETITLDQESKRRLRDVVEAVTTTDERATVATELERLSRLDLGESSNFEPDLYDYVITVTEALSDRGYSLSVTHEDRHDLSPLDACAYSLIHSQDPRWLRALDVSTPVTNALTNGVECLATDAEQTAWAAFSEAVASSENHTENVISRIMAGWASFLSGDDDAALEYIQTALELEDSSWAARIVEESVNKDTDNAIRARRKSVGLILRWSVIDSDNTRTRTELGSRLPGDEIEWAPIDHVGGHAMLNHVTPETWIRFRLHGKLPDFPVFQLYYLGYGLYNTEMDLVEEVYHQITAGPAGPGTVERIEIYQ